MLFRDSSPWQRKLPDEFTNIDDAASIFLKDYKKVISVLESLKEEFEDKHFSEVKVAEQKLETLGEVLGKEWKFYRSVVSLSRNKCRARTTFRPVKQIKVSVSA